MSWREVSSDDQSLRERQLRRLRLNMVAKSRPGVGGWRKVSKMPSLSSPQCWPRISRYASASRGEILAMLAQVLSRSR